MSEPRPGMGWKPGRGTKAHLFGAIDVYTPQPTVSHASHYDLGWWGNQGNTPECTIYSHLHIAHDSPITRSGIKPCLDPDKSYLEGRAVDGSSLTIDDGPDGGLTCDAAAQVMKRHGIIGEYRWLDPTESMTADERLDALLDVLVAAPVTIGADWLEDMFHPNIFGFVSYSGKVAGGHQWVANAFNKNEKWIRHKNSWGRQWAKRGRFYTSFDTMKKILARPQTAVCVSRELPKGNLIP